MSLGKKNGGGIDVYYSILLGVAGMVVAASLTTIGLHKEQLAMMQRNAARHLMMIEMIYAVRNEINDETFYAITIEEADVTIRIRFQKLKQTASLYLLYQGEASIHGFDYDKDCLCITNYYELDKEHEERSTEE